MSSAFVMNLWEEMTCPICLELLREPVILDCGHNFCQACITVNNEASGVSSEGESTCPMCKTRYQPDNLRPNWHLANIVEKLREVEVNPEEEQKRDVCERHGEKLLLFCQEDGKVMCWLCERSQEHRGHHTFLVEEVVQEYQAKITAAVESLRMVEEEAEKLGADIREEKAFWKNQIWTEKQDVQALFGHLRSVLDSEEQSELEKLQQEEENALCHLAKDEDELGQQRQLLQELLSDLERRLQASSVEMLQDVNDIIRRSETFRIKRSRIVPKKQRISYKTPDLRETLQGFRELTDARRYWVHLTLKPAARTSMVTITDDGKRSILTSIHLQNNGCLPGPQTVSSLFAFGVNYCAPVQKVPSNNVSWFQNDPDNTYGILGSPCIESGKYYWEVDVSHKTGWILGVCSSNNHTDSVYPGYQNCSSSYGPQYDYWVLELRNGSTYTAVEYSSLKNPCILTLYLPVPPCRIGIFLDYEAYSLSFFNITNPGSLIYKFCNCNFLGPVCPYFSPVRCKSPMVLCSPDS